MLLQKKGFPNEGELVLCTITKIQLNSVFVKIDEYNSSGMIHISEISPGRIRNIRDFVKEGKKVVCVVLKINTERGHIDLSLRRVNESQKKKKIEYIKQQQKAEKIIEFVAGNCNMEIAVLYNEVMKKIEEDYDDLVSFFGDVVTDEAKLSDYGLDKKYTAELEQVVRQRVKPPQVNIEGVFTIECFHGDGVEVIKKAFLQIDAGKVASNYLGGGRYHISVTSSNYKDAESILEDAKGVVTDYLEKSNAQVGFARIDKKK